MDWFDPMFSMAASGAEFGLSTPLVIAPGEPDQLRWRWRSDSVPGMGNALAKLVSMPLSVASFAGDTGQLL